MTKLIPLALIALSVGFAGCDKTSTPVQTSNNTSTNPPATRPDNTGINERDRAADAKTAGMSGQKKSDVELTADIRKKIMDAKLSVDAQNCKVVVQDGMVTLRGPVPSQDEKDQIEKIARVTAGDASKIDNQLEVKMNP